MTTDREPLPRTLAELHDRLFDREFALVVAETKLGQAMLAVYDWDDEAATEYLAPYVEARNQAERRVGSVKELIGYLTPSSYATNYR